MDEKSVQTFWDAHPCGEEMVGGVRGDYEEFFRRYDDFRYSESRHLLKCLDEVGFEGKRVLEIGLGLGADSEQIIRRGGISSGVDLTPESASRVATRLKLRKLPHESLVVGSACSLPFPDASFDIVFSHGVLHHIPEIGQAQKEIGRVLKPDGRLVAMLYAKYSLNYLLSIFLLRRLALGAVYVTGARPAGKVGQHLENARSMGLLRYLRMENFTHRNTDGPLNPYAKVYSLREVRREFTRFDVVSAHKQFMHAPPLPVSWLPCGRLLGWHLWVEMRPKA
jgi:SAM-dependent methyltransferase